MKLTCLIVKVFEIHGEILKGRGVRLFKGLFKGGVRLDYFKTLNVGLL